MKKLILTAALFLGLIVSTNALAMTNVVGTLETDSLVKPTGSTVTVVFYVANSGNVHVGPDYTPTLTFRLDPIGMAYDPINSNDNIKLDWAGVSYIQLNAKSPIYAGRVPLVNNQNRPLKPGLYRLHGSSNFKAFNGAAVTESFTVAVDTIIDVRRAGE